LRRLGNPVADGIGLVGRVIPRDVDRPIHMRESLVDRPTGATIDAPVGGLPQ
jgi:hypothetical protein